MTNREKWIVYPFLFLAICMGVHDQNRAEIKVPKLTCYEVETVSRVEGVPLTRINGDALEVFDRSGRRTLRISGDLIEIFGSVKQVLPADEDQEDGEPITLDQAFRAIALGIDRDHNAGKIQTFDAERRIMLELSATGEGGAVQAFDVEGNPQVQLLATDEGGVILPAPPINLPGEDNLPGEEGEAETSADQGSADE